MTESKADNKGSQVWTHLHARSPLPVDVIAMIWDMVAPQLDHQQVQTMLDELMTAVREYKRKNINLAAELAARGSTARCISFGRGVTMREVLKDMRENPERYR
jgi:hypothetical protein